MRTVVNCNLRLKFLSVISILALSAAITLAAYASEPITNTSQLVTVFGRPELLYPRVWAWEPAMFEGQEIWWANFTQLKELAPIRNYPGYELMGVTFWPLQLTQLADTGEIVVKYPCFDAELLRLETPGDYHPFKRYDEVLASFYTPTDKNVTAYAELLSRGWTFLDPPRITLDVWLGDVQDLQVYEQNVAEEQASEEAAEVMAAETEAADQVDGDRAVGGIMLMDGGNPCDTNTSLFILSIDYSGEGFTTIIWGPTCSNLFMYGVFSADELTEDTQWTARAAMWGAPDGPTTSWTDDTTTDLLQKFYKVLRTNAEDDFDGDTIPNGWELDHGSNPLDGNDANEPSSHPWAYGLSNLQVYENPSVLIADNYSTLDDGIADWWKVMYGFSLTDPTVAGNDTDNDWWSNFAEYQDWTNPTDPDDHFPYAFTINGGGAVTTNAQVGVGLAPGLMADYTILSEDPEFTASVTNSFSLVFDYTLQNTAEGTHTLYMQLLNANNTTSPVFSGTVELDGTLPSISIASPTDGAVVFQRRINIAGFAADVSTNAPQLDPRRWLQVTVNGNFVNDRDTNGVWWIGPQDLVPGTNTFAAMATDRAGGSVTNSIFVIYDPSLATNVPVFTVSVTNTVTFGVTTTQFALGGTIDDSNAMVQVDVLDAVDNTITNASVSAAVGMTNWWVTVPVLSGTNLVKVTARNSASPPNSQSFTTIQATGVFFEITSPVANATVNGTNVTVTGIASLSLSGATITINGQPAAITVRANNITFSSTSPVSLDAGGNVIDVEATGGALGDQKLTAMQTVYGYELLTLRFYSRYFGQSSPDCNFQDFTVTWDTAQDGIYHARLDAYWCFEDPSTHEWDSPISFDCGLPQGDVCLDSAGSGAIGDWWVDQDVGVNAGLLDTRLTVLKHAPADEEQVVVFHFDELEYFRLNDVFNTEYPRTSFDPSTITFRGSPGFWHIDEEGQTNGVAFLIKIRTNSPFTIQNSDFQFPSLPDVGWNGNGYCHRLTFRGFGNEQALKIKWSGVDITGKTTNTIVGQRISLIAELAAGLSASQYEWTLPSMVVSDFVATASSGQKIDLTETDLTKPNVSFAWVTRGVKQVGCVATLAPGVSGPAFATFNVQRPVASIATITSTVAADSDFQESGAWLHFGNATNTPGIGFCQTNSLPSGFSGNYQFVQLVDPYRTRLLTNEIWQTWQGAGLDTSYPYLNGTNSCVLDAPGTELTSEFLEKTTADAFQMWLMFKPGEDGIWVPLRKVNWSWSGHAVFTNGVWGLISGNNSTNPPDSDTTVYPTWSRNAANNTWQ